MVIQGISYPSDFEAKKAIIAAAAKLESKGYMVAGDGSLSMRVGPNALWITVEGADKSALTQEQLVRIDMQGKQAATNKPKPLGEYLASHLKVYRENENVQCVIHAYPVCSVMLSSMGQGIEPAGFTPAVRRLGRVQLLSSADSQKTADEIALICKTDRGVVLDNDGCMMWGRSSVETVGLIEALDYYCKAMKCTNCGNSCNSCTSRQHSHNSNECSHNCAVCDKAGFCTEVQQLNFRKPVPDTNTGLSAQADRPSEEIDITVLPKGMTGLIRPGQSLPAISEDKAAEPAVSVSALQPVTTDAVSENKETLVTNVPKSVVMAEVVRRTLNR